MTPPGSPDDDGRRDARLVAIVLAVVVLLVLAGEAATAVELLRLLAFVP